MVRLLTWAPGTGRAGSQMAKGSSGWLCICSACGPFSVGRTFAVEHLVLELGLLRLRSGSP